MLLLDQVVTSPLDGRRRLSDSPPAAWPGFWDRLAGMMGSCPGLGSATGASPDCAVAATYGDAHFFCQDATASVKP